MLRKRRQLGFTLIELLIVIAIIGILAAIAIPMYRAQTVKAKLTEVSNSMSNVSSAVAAYYQEEGSFPGTTLTDAVSIKTTLGVAIPAGLRYISAASVMGGGAQAGRIIFTIMATGEASVDGGTLTLSPTTNSQGAINWFWSGSIPIVYYPKK